MSDGPPRTHNLPPDIRSVLAPDRVKELIDKEIDASPLAADGTRVPSIRDREVQLVAMCRRFLKAYPRIEDEERGRIAAEVLHTCSRFAGDSGRIEKAREAFKAPVIAAGRLIDAEFGRFGKELIVRPLTGPPRGRRIAPLTLAEQIANQVIEKTERDDERIRAAAQAEAERLEKEAQLARDLAAKGRTTVGAGDAAEAEEAAAKQRAVTTAPMNKLTRTSGNLAGSTSGRRVRIFEIVDANLVPRQYCEPSDKLLRAGVGAPDTPIPEIPGVVIRDETDLNRR